MILSKITLITFLGLIISSTAHNDAQIFVAVHNKARAQVGVGPIHWDPQLAQFAQNYAEQRKDCALIHSGTPDYGENCALWTEEHNSAYQAAHMWVEEGKYYDIKTDTCAPGHGCGHYTQVVWRNSTSLGCGKVTCFSGWVFVVCNYNPPGNYLDTRPY